DEECARLADAQQAGGAKDRLTEGEAERQYEGAAHREKEELLETKPSARAPDRLHELAHRRPLDRLPSPAEEEVDDDRNCRRQDTGNRETRNEERHAPPRRAAAWRRARSLLSAGPTDSCESSWRKS